NSRLPPSRSRETASAPAVQADEEQLAELDRHDLFGRRAEMQLLECVAQKLRHIYSVIDRHVATRRWQGPLAQGTDGEELAARPQGLMEKPDLLRRAGQMQQHPNRQDRVEAQATGHQLAQHIERHGGKSRGADVADGELPHRWT